jgi:hypothetical protein
LLFAELPFSFRPTEDHRGKEEDFKTSETNTRLKGGLSSARSKADQGGVRKTSQAAGIGVDLVHDGERHLTSKEPSSGQRTGKRGVNATAKNNEISSDVGIFERNDFSWEYYNRFHKAWPVQEPYPSMRAVNLGHLISYLWPGAPPQEMWAVAVGGPDAMTRSLGEMKGHLYNLDRSNLPKKFNMRLILGKITPTNFVESLQHDSDMPRDFQILKMDIDGFECDLLESLLGAGYRPKILIVEANPAWPPPFKWHLRFSPDWFYGKGGTFFYGCSFQSVHDLLQPHGYFVLQYVMEDAWFVRNDTMRDDMKDKLALHPRDAYLSGNPHGYHRCSSKKSKYVSEKILSIQEQSEFIAFVEDIEKKEIICGKAKYTSDHTYFYQQSLRQSQASISAMFLFFFVQIMKSA